VASRKFTPGTYAFFISPDSDDARTLCATLQKAIKDRLSVASWWSDSASGAITEIIVDRIRDAKVVLADLRGARPNVYYEIGLAHAFEIPVVLLGGDEDTHFDLAGERRISIDVDTNRHPMEDALAEDVRRALDELDSEQARTAVRASNLRRKASAPSNPTPSTHPSIVAGGDPRGIWRDLAMTGALPPLNDSHLLPDVRVVHLEYGLGRIQGHSPAAGGSMSVTVSFETGVAVIPLPDPRLFRAEVWPAT
jgi:hypothetical protein